MKGFLKCYYGYRNRGDELLFGGVLRYIFDKYDIEHLYIEVGDKPFMQQWINNNKALFATYTERITLVPKEEVKQYHLEDTFKFFGGGEVLTDEIEIPKNSPQEKKTIDQRASNNTTDQTTDKKNQTKKKNDTSQQATTKQSTSAHIDISRLQDMPTVNNLDDMIEEVQDSRFIKFLQKTLHTTKHLASKYFARAGWNYYIKYYNDIQKGNFVLLGGITTPHKITTKLLYKLLLPKAKAIICRDKTSYLLCKKYSSAVLLYDDFGKKFLESEPKPTPQDLPPKIQTPYILINVHRRIRNEKTRLTIRHFCEQHADCQIYYFPADIVHDTTFFKILQKELPDVILYDRTKYSISETLALFAHARAGIGARLHFLLPLKIYSVPFEPLVYAEKVKKLVLDDHSDLKLLKKNEKGSTYQGNNFKMCYRNKGTISGDNETNPQEDISLIEGRAKVTIKEDEKVYEAPCFFSIPAHTFHKIEALTDITFILQEK